MDEFITIELMEDVIDDAVASYNILDGIEDTYTLPKGYSSYINPELVRMTQHILILLVKLDERYEIENNDYDRKDFERFEASVLKAIGVTKR